MSGFDVLVLGEPMVERHHDADGRTLAPDSVSGDAFNAASAAALAGARVALLTVLGEDDAAELVIRELERRGIHTGHIARASAPTGAYTVTSDVHGQPRFSYQRAGSAATTLACTHLDRWGPVIDSAPVLVTSGITSALSDGAAELVSGAIRRASEAGSTACYDVNFRPGLTSPERARRLLDEVAPGCGLVKIASPGDSVPLLGLTDPAEVSAALRALTDAAIVVSQGSQPIVLSEQRQVMRYPILPMPRPVDTTGAGDVLLGTLAAALAAGSALASALPVAVAAAGLSTQHRGGAARASLNEVLAALQSCPEPSHALNEESRS
ncbi:PfkB family carbohydrate kinase [Pseudonocardia spinosispora]|uniref:PfkB family carbohydrate kinase n=1 Tax=Pseudonocardia spinosispora TaxID=103441 RepID=UPI0003F8DBA6|nr:PfkB family carbohydrate kinase [Pseudonocardia spinosispora]